MEFTCELLNEYTIKITSKEIKMNAYERMKLQDYVDGLEIWPANLIFELGTDESTRSCQVATLKRLERDYKLTAEQKKIFDKFITENSEENSKPRRKKMKPIFWAWTYKIYEGKKMKSSDNEYCGYLHSYSSKAEREEECRFTHEEKVGPLTITLKTEPIKATQAYKALLEGNGVPQDFLRRQYMIENQEGRDLTLPELLNLWRSTCIDLKL